MIDQYHIGQRLSFENSLCSVRYIGPVEGTYKDAIWFGVEWDDHNRGKHSGEHQSKRYFHCRSSFPTAASFVRTTRQHDRSLSFIEALGVKYGAEKQMKSRFGHDHVGNDRPTSTPVVISGKLVEEVGFDKVSKQQSSFQELRIVLLDGMCLDAATRKGEALEDARNAIATTCPNVVELDLSRNLLENWETVGRICQPLEKLKILRLNGNRFGSFEQKEFAIDPFRRIKELSLEECLLDWNQMSSVFSNNYFSSLQFLSLSGNHLLRPSDDFKISLGNLRELNLDFNEFSSLTELDWINKCFPGLVKLSLQDNQISSIAGPSLKGATFPTVSDLSLSRNKIAAWTFLDELNLAMPALRTLRINANPIFGGSRKQDAGSSLLGMPSASQTSSTPRESTVEAAFMMTVGRLAKITSLNYSHITPQERMNAELFYLAEIEKEATEKTRQQLSVAHPRYLELCEKYDRDSVVGKPVQNSEAELPDSLAARLVNIRFYRSLLREQSGAEYRKAIPKSIDIYRLKGLVARTFGLPPLSFRLIYETELLDEVMPNRPELSEEMWDRISVSVDGKVDGEEPWRKLGSDATVTAKQKEIELVDSTRDLAHFLESDVRDINVRIETY
ncbi:MAG: hypothetical protein Q9160_007934 [Pyrenula sp. 1 TL-2023]